MEEEEERDVDVAAGREVLEEIAEELVTSTLVETTEEVDAGSVTDETEDTKEVDEEAAGAAIGTVWQKAPFR